MANRIFPFSPSSRLTGLVAALALFAAAPGAAQDYGSADWGISSSTISDMIQADMINRSLMSLQDAAGISGDSGGETTRAEPARKTEAAPKKVSLDLRGALNAAGDGFTDETGIEELARLFPRSEFQDRKRRFTAGILQLGDAAQQAYGVPKLNLATGMTAVVAGAYAAYTGEVLPDSYVKPLYRQFERRMSSEPAIGSASLEAKAATYQISMGLGIVLTGLSTQFRSELSPAEQAELQRLGATTLSSIFGVDASRIRFSKKGYSIN